MGCIARDVQRFVTAGLTERDGNGRGWNVKRLGQRRARCAIRPAVFRGFTHADSQACAVSRTRPALDAGPARLRLDLHGNADTIARCSPKNSHCD